MHRGNPAVQVGSHPREEALCPLSLKQPQPPKRPRIVKASRCVLRAERLHGNDQVRIPYPKSEQACLFRTPRRPRGSPRARSLGVLGKAGSQAPLRTPGGQSAGGAWQAAVRAPRHGKAPICALGSPRSADGTQRTKGCQNRQMRALFPEEPSVTLWVYFCWVSFSPLPWLVCLFVPSP